MKSNISAAICFIKSNPPLLSFRFADQYIFFAAAFAQRIHRRMLYEKQIVPGVGCKVLGVGLGIMRRFNGYIFAQQLFLVFPGRTIFHKAEITKPNRHFFLKRHAAKVSQFTKPYTLHLTPDTLNYYLCGMSNQETGHFPDHEDQPEGSEELYERMSLTVDRGQEPMRLDKFL